jgi:O-antigen ligase
LRKPYRLGSGNGFFFVCALVAVAALVLGGGTRSGFLSDVILQLLAVPLLLAAVWRFFETPPSRPECLGLAFCVALVAVPLLQIIPLPPEIWTALPNRQPEIEALELARLGRPWMPISLSPNATLLSALSLVVPIAIFLGTLLLDYRHRRWLTVVVLAAGIVSVFVGLSQVAQGPSSPLRFFDFTNTTEATGFFANRNHFSALLYALMLLAAAWAVDAALNSGSAGSRQLDGPPLIALLISFTVLVALVAAQLMARSRAGLALTIIALLGALALAFTDRRDASTITPSRMLAGVIVIVAMLSTQFVLYRVLERFTSDPLKDARIPFANTTIEAAHAFMPLGAGVGTFVPVYALFEKPQDVMVNTFANRAHNDVLEIWLESGVIGLALLGLFLAWYLWRAFSAWRQSSYGVNELDSALARAATLIIALLIAHSLVDYPLRTGAMMTIFAFACALLVPPRAALRQTSALEAAPAGPSATQSWPQQAPPGPPSDIQRPPGRPWGAEVEWPEQWRPDGTADQPKRGGS